MLFGVMLFVHLDVAVVRAQSNLPGIATLNDESSASDSETPPADGSSGEESLSDILDGDVEPKILRRPLLPSDQESLPSDQPDLDQWVDPIFDAPTGYTGMSGIAPLESQTSGHFVPVEDRWRAGFPEWDRYGKGYVPVDDVPYEVGHWWDPFNQNVLKGDYPIVGQHTFFNITATNLLIFEPRSVPTPTTPFESTKDPDSPNFFGNPNQLFVSNFIAKLKEL